MHYLGHFTFDGERLEGSPLAGPTTGWFTMLVEADSAKEAIDKFGDLIESLDDSGFEGFDSVRNIYFEEAIEVKKATQRGRLGPLDRVPRPRVLRDY